MVVLFREDIMQKSRFCRGDLVIYRMTKYSTRPGPRATNVHPARYGDTYSYTVDKFWVVADILADGTVVALTRRGKKNHVRANDPMLKRANWLQKLLYRARFAALPERSTVTQGELTAS